MKFEHFAQNVPDPVRMAEWYVAHLGMTTVLSLDHSPHTRFLADESGRVCMELYSNPAAPVHDCRSIHPLTFHVAFETRDAEAERNRLVAAGATDVEVVRPPDGSLLYMLRDPWGLPLQICQRTRPFLP